MRWPLTRLSKNSIDPQNRGCLAEEGWAWSGVRQPMTNASGSLGTMVQLSSPLRFMLVALAGWVNQQQSEVIDYLQEENRAFGNSSVPDVFGSRTINAVVWR
jgi:hypothetical protein